MEKSTDKPDIEKQCGPPRARESAPLTWHCTLALLVVYIIALVGFVQYVDPERFHVTRHVTRPFAADLHVIAAFEPAATPTGVPTAAAAAAAVEPGLLDMR